MCMLFVVEIHIIVKSGKVMLQSALSLEIR